MNTVHRRLCAVFFAPVWSRVGMLARDRDWSWQEISSAAILLGRRAVPAPLRFRVGTARRVRRPAGRSRGGYSSRPPGRFCGAPLGRPCQCFRAKLASSRWRSSGGSRRVTGRIGCVLPFCHGVACSDGLFARLPRQGVRRPSLPPSVGFVDAQLHFDLLEVALASRSCQGCISDGFPAVGFLAVAVRSGEKSCHCFCRQSASGRHHGYAVPRSQVAVGHMGHAEVSREHGRLVSTVSRSGLEQQVDPLRSPPVPLVRLFVLEQPFVPVELGQPPNADAFGSSPVRCRLRPAGGRFSPRRRWRPRHGRSRLCRPRRRRRLRGDVRASSGPFTLGSAATFGHRTYKSAPGPECTDSPPEADDPFPRSGP